jgi:hypothetical protein
LELESQRGSPVEDVPYEEETPRQPSRLAVPEVVIKQPTPRKAPAHIEDMEDYDSAMLEVESLGRDLRDATHILESFYFKQNPNASPIEDSPAGFHILVQEVQKLLNAKAAQPVPGGYPITPAKDTATDAASATLSQAPKKGKEKVSKTRQVFQTLGESFLPRAPPLPNISSLWGSAQAPPPRPSPRLSLFGEPPVIHRTASVPPARRVSTSPLFGNPAGPSFNPARPTPIVQPTPQQQHHVPQNAPPTPQQSHRTPTRVRMSEPPGSDPSHSDDSDSSQGPSNPRSSRHSSTPFRRSGTVDSTASTSLGRSKLKPPKLEKNDGTGKWRKAAVFDNWQNDLRDILKVGELDPASEDAMI